MSKAKIVLVSFVWLVILAIGVAIFKLWYVPKVDKDHQQAEEQVVSATTGESPYKHHLKIGLDGFSGYAILRSPEFKQQLRQSGIKLDVIDDGADYVQRLSRLATGELELAAFPIDALIKTSAQRKALPATIVAIIDETRGADALICYKQRYPNVDSLNNSNTKFVLVAESPSETLTRVLMHSFLGNAKPTAFIPVDNEKQLLERYRAATPSGNEVFVTWEPVVSEMLKNDQLHVLFDSSQQSGYIVDTLVVSRDFFIKQEPVVKQFLESYFRTLYTINNGSKDPNDPKAALKELIKRDADSSGLKLDSKQVERLVDGISWKHTEDNYAHFGLPSGGATHIEDMIDRVRRVLIETKGLANDPTDGQSNKLFNQTALAEMYQSAFRAGVSQERVEAERKLVALSDQQWNGLTNVATFSVPPLVFARGTSILTDHSESILQDLALDLKSFPLYYVTISGNSGSRGDPQANQVLAKQRAEAALQYLTSQGVDATRMRAVIGEKSDEMSVTFRLGQSPL